MITVRRSHLIPMRYSCIGSSLNHTSATMHMHLHTNRICILMQSALRVGALEYGLWPDALRKNSIPFVASIVPSGADSDARYDDDLTSRALGMVSEVTITSLDRRVPDTRKKNRGDNFLLMCYHSSWVMMKANCHHQSSSTISQRLCKLSQVIYPLTLPRYLHGNSDKALKCTWSHGVEAEISGAALPS
jgi:hypothetical protein